MKRHVFPILIGLAVVGVSTPVAAADSFTDRFSSVFEPFEPAHTRPHVYFGTRARVSKVDDTNLGFAGGQATSSYDVGFGSAAIVGYGTGGLWGPVGGRIEAEAGIFSSDVSDVTVAGVTRSEADSTGSVSALTGYLSAYVDGHLGRMTPFVGGGVGLTRVELSDQGSFTDGLVVDDTATGLAAHLSAGLGIAVTQSLTVELGYRHEFFTDAEFTATDGSVTSIDTERQSLTLGIRRAF